MTIVLLGSSGFIGGKIRDLLQKHNLDFVQCDRNLNFYFPGNVSTIEKPLNQLLKNLGKELTVVNMVGNSIGSQQMILDANYSFPLKVLDVLGKSGVKIRWLQASSYFQNYKSSFGTDKDYYAKTKQQVLEELQSRTPTQDFELINLVLPHVTGVNEPVRRLIPQLILARVLEKEVNLGSGRPLLPIIGVESIAREVIAIALDKTSRPKIELHPIAYLTVREIAELILKDDLELALFGKLPDRINEFYTFETIGLPNATGDKADVRKIFEAMEKFYSQTKN